jgi:hypothetical protein
MTRNIVHVGEIEGKVVERFVYEYLEPLFFSENNNFGIQWTGSCKCGIHVILAENLHIPLGQFLL